MLGNIPLPTGTKTVTVREIPRLLALALHPDRSGNPRIVSSLMKQVIAPDAIPAPRCEHLTDDDWNVLGAIWHDLPRYREGMSEPGWLPYVEAFANAKYKPDWELLPVWRDAGMGAKISQISAEQEHKELLAAAVANGELAALSPLTFAPKRTAQGEELQNLLVMVDELKQYAARFQIGIQEAAPLEQDEPVTLNLADAVKIDDAAKEVGCSVESLLRKAARSELVLYAALNPHSAKLAAIPSHTSPREAAYETKQHTLVALLPQYSESLIIAGSAEIRQYSAGFRPPHDWHFWMLDAPQTIGIGNVFVSRSDVVHTAAPAIVQQAATGGTPKVKTGRPPTIKIKAEIVRQIIDAIEQAAGKKFDTGALPGNASDLLDACQRIEKAVNGKASKMTTSAKTFKKWVRAAGYSFPDGRTPKDQATFWTGHTPATIPKINAGVFAEVIPDSPL